MEVARPLSVGCGNESAASVTPCRTEASHTLSGIPRDERDLVVGTSQFPRGQAHLFGVRDRQGQTIDRVSPRGNRDQSAPAEKELLRDAVRPGSVGEYVGRWSSRLAACRAPPRAQ